MTSVFSAGFIENLRRIHESSSRQLGQWSAVSNDFQQVLGDIQKGSKNTSNNNGLSEKSTALEAPTQSPGGVISNLEPIERMELKSEVPSIIYNIKADIKTGVTTDKPVNVNVKIPATSVNKLVPTTSNTDVPKTPNLLIAAKIDHKIETPDKPTMLSATALNSTGVAVTPKLTKKVQTVSPSYPTKIPLQSAEIREIIQTAGRYHGIDPTLGLAIAQVESSLKPHAISQDGHETKGLFQLLDTTGKSMLRKLQLEDSYDPFDPAQNTFLGVGYLRRLHDLFSKETVLAGNLSTTAAKSADDLEKLAIAAFNAGEGNVARAQRRAARIGKNPASFVDVEPFLPSSTRAYVSRVANLRRANQSVSEII